MLHLTWVYDRPVDLVELQGFCDRLNRGRLSRLVERSRVWGATDRWVAMDHPVEMVVDNRTRPRSEAQQWSREQSQARIDPQNGPPWRLATVPLTDGGAVVALVISHTIADGFGSMLGIFEGTDGSRMDLGYPRRGSRGFWSGLKADLAQAFRSLPGIGGAFKALIAGARAEREIERRKSRTPLALTDGGGQKEGAASTIVVVDDAQWKACAARLGGTSNVMVAAVAAALGERLGRVQADGSVNLSIPVNTRESMDDLRGNVLSAVTINVDPKPLATDLTPLRATLREAYKAKDENPPSVIQALPLVPFVPAWLLRRLEGAALNAEVQTMGCSNSGDVPEPLLAIDGAPAQCAYGQYMEPGRTTEELIKMAGQGFIGSSTSGGWTILSGVAYRPGEDNSDEALKQMLVEILVEFGLTPELELV